nr:MAG TPA: hypothetical protein [Caudoviricetes sp.]
MTFGPPSFSPQLCTAGGFFFILTNFRAYFVINISTKV